MDRMTDSGSVGWAFESPRDHMKKALNALFSFLVFRFAHTGTGFFFRNEDSAKMELPFQVY
jgi:hypothetical protein